MLSLFPYLLSYSQLSPFLIRITLAIIFLFWAYHSLKKSSSTPKQKTVGILEVVSGILLLIGLWTQAAALFLAIDLIVRLIEKINKKAFLTDGVNYYLILLIMAISLLVTGAGWFAFDLPL